MRIIAEGIDRVYRSFRMFCTCKSLKASVLVLHFEKILWSRRNESANNIIITEICLQVSVHVSRSVSSVICPSNPWSGITKKIFFVITEVYKSVLKLYWNI